METQRYPISVRVMGVMHKEKSKVSADGFSYYSLLIQNLRIFYSVITYEFFALIQMFMTSVLWSDQNDIVVYRTFRDFKEMHVSMLVQALSCACPGRCWFFNNMSVDSLLQKQMKKAFPPASKLKKSDKIIPSFGGMCA